MLYGNILLLFMYSLGSSFWEKNIRFSDMVLYHSIDMHGGHLDFRSTQKRHLVEYHPRNISSKFSVTYWSSFPYSQYKFCPAVAAIFYFQSTQNKLFRESSLYVCFTLTIFYNTTTILNDWWCDIILVHADKPRSIQYNFCSNWVNCFREYL